MVETGDDSGSGLELRLEWCSHLSGLAPALESKIIGQKGAITRVAQAVQAAELGLNERRSQPKASFLFLGPTGVGKTETAKCFSEYIFGSRTGLEMVFMNEYSSAGRGSVVGLFSSGGIEREGEAPPFTRERAARGVA